MICLQKLYEILIIFKNSAKILKNFITVSLYKFLKYLYFYKKMLNFLNILYINYIV